MLRERMRDLVREYLREFRIRWFQFPYQAGVQRHFATGHSPGVHRFGIVDHHEIPVPVARFRTHHDRLGDDPIGNRADPFVQRGVGIQAVFRRERIEHFRVCLARCGDRALLGYDEELRATGGARGAGSEDDGDENGD